MARYLGIKKDKIFIVSDHEMHGAQHQVLKLSNEFDNVSSEDLIIKYKVVNGNLKCKNYKKPANEIKLALVGNYKSKCGIASYSYSLWSELFKKVKHIKLFIEKNDSPIGDIYELGNSKLDKNQVSSCWKRGESLQELIKELKDYDPDIILISHEFGLWPNANHWLSFMNQISEFRNIVIMHSVFHHKDKTICEAAMPEIITHLQGGHDVLKYEKGIPGKVYVIPHGCDPASSDRLWNFYKSEHTFIQAGFLFRYKSFESSIKALAILKEKYPDVFFTGLLSESPHNKAEHQLYYNDLMDLIEDLGVQENVALIRGYQSESSIDSYLRTNKVAIFPYISNKEHEVFGVSGAARMAMSTGMPVITSSVNHFSDLNTIKCDTPEQIANELDKLFSDPSLIKKQIDIQNKYIAENTWDKIADRYIKLFENG